MTRASFPVVVTLGACIALAACTATTPDTGAPQPAVAPIASPVFAVQPLSCTIRDVCSVGVGCSPMAGTLTLTPVDATTYRVTGAGQTHMLRFQDVVVVVTSSGTLRSDVYVDEAATTDLLIGRNNTGQRTATLRTLTEAPFPSISSRCTP